MNLFPSEAYHHELGDATGPFKSTGGIQGNPGVAITFSTIVDGETIEWVAPVEEGVSYSSENFVNAKGNGFVVIHLINSTSSLVSK